MSTLGFRLLRFLAALLLLGLAPLFPCAAETQVLILKSRESVDHDLLVGGFKEHLAGGGITPVYVERVIAEGDNAPPSADLVLAVGSPALRWALERDISDPIVFSAVMLPAERIPRLPNLTGSLLSIPAAAQLRAFAEALPQARRIGIIHVEEENRQFVGEAAAEAKALRIELKGYAVTSAKDIPKLADMPIDALWIVPNSVTGQLPVLQHLLTTSFRYRIPVLTGSAAYVTAGAALGVCPDYADIGRQSAEMAREILGGRSAGSFPPSHPRTFITLINVPVAEKLRIRFPEKTLRTAERIGDR